jgi:hypothetical protein
MNKNDLMKAALEEGRLGDLYGYIHDVVLGAMRRRHQKLLYKDEDALGDICMMVLDKVHKAKNHYKLAGYVMLAYESMLARRQTRLSKEPACVGRISDISSKKSDMRGFVVLEDRTKVRCPRTGPVVCSHRARVSLQRPAG